VAKAANYTVVQQGEVTLKDPNTDDIDFSYPTFSAPGLSTSQAMADRPYLLFTVDPVGNDAKVELKLNGKEVYSETFFSGSATSVNEVLDHGDLLPAGNELILASRGAGTFAVSDMTVGFKVTV
jgi:hypothetical protein